MGWRSEAGQDRSRVLARCADQGSGAAALTAQFENELWLKARSWKDYCETLARTAASLGHESCLRVLHEMGGDAAASLAAADADGFTPAHLAAAKGYEGCLRVLHELLCIMIDPQLAMLAGSFAGTARDDLIQELRARRSLAWTQGTTPFDYVDSGRSKLSAAAMAARKGHANCFRFIADVGGAAGFLRWLRGCEHFIDDTFPCLLTDPALLDLETKRGWLNAQLSLKVQDVGSDADINLIVHRDDMLPRALRCLGRA